jgi:hypothetical protein
MDFMNIKTKQLLVASIIGIICLFAGVYIGKYFATENDNRLLAETMAIDESYELLKLAELLEDLENGRIQEVIDILHVDIKTTLSEYDDSYYNNLSLTDESRKTIRANRQAANDVLQRYPNDQTVPLKDPDAK